MNTKKIELTKEQSKWLKEIVDREIRDLNEFLRTRDLSKKDRKKYQKEADMINDILHQLRN